MNDQPPEIGGFGPVTQRATIADNVYNELRTALVVGRFDPGQTLTISSLAEAFQTSHMPVREAMRRLGAEGAVEVRSNGSAYVPEVTRVSLDDICRARIALERLATGLAVTKMTAAEIATLELLEHEHTATSHLNNVYEMLKKNHLFHFSIYRAARSPTLLQLIDILWVRYGPFMRMLSDHMGPQLGMGVHEPFMLGHRAIVDAIRSRDAVRAEDLLQDDIERTQRLLQRHCE